MTTPTIIPINLFNGDEPDYRILLPELTDERLILKGLIEIQRDAAAYLVNVAQRDLDPEQPYSVLSDRALTQFDYNGDHVDYNPAAARTLSMITDELCGDGYHRDQLNADIVTALAIPDADWNDDYIHTPRSVLAFLLTSTDFLEEYETWGGSINSIFDLCHKDDMNDEDKEN